VQQPSASEKPSDPNRTQKLIAALKAHPKLPIPEMAKAVYGVNSDPSRNRVRSLLATLQSREIVKRVGPGEWVLDKEA
jgi:hypothetical protein